MKKFRYLVVYFCVAVLLLPSSVLAAVITYYVNTDCTSFAGDGTSSACATSGGGVGAYQNVDQAITARTQNLVSAGNQMDILCRGAAADTVWLGDLHGMTTGSSTFVRVKGDNATTGKHLGVWSTGKFRVSNSNYGGAIVPTGCASNTCYLRFENFQVENKGTGSDPARGIFFGDAGATQGVFYVRQMLIRYNPSSTPTTNGQNSGIMIQSHGSTGTRKIFAINNVIYGFHAAGFYWNSAGGDVGEEVYGFNNTIKNNGSGGDVGIFSYGTSDIFQWKNNIMGSYYRESSATDTFSTNSTTDTSGPNAALWNISPTFVSETFATADYHLAGADTGAVEKGTSLAADPSAAFSSDFEGDTRPQGTSWDLGADERVPSGSGYKPILPWQRTLQPLSGLGTQ
jgi:hypothetical protein